MKSKNDLAALGLIGAAIALLMTVLLPRPSWAASSDRVEWGLHHVELQHTEVVVHSTWSLDGAPSDSVPLAMSLPPSTELTGAEPVADASGRIVALTLPDYGGELHMETRVPLRHVREDEALPVLVPEGRSVQRVVLDPSLSFSPDPALGLIAQVGHYAPADLDVVDRHRFDARTDGNLRNVGAYYVRGDDLQPVGALRGEVTLRRQRMGRAALVVGGIFGVVVLAMVFVQRRLNRHVRHERAEAYLAREFDALDHDVLAGSAAQTQTSAPTVPT